MCYLQEWSVEPAWFEATVDNAVCTCIPIESFHLTSHPA